jgi:hypothetical protein
MALVCPMVGNAYGRPIDLSICVVKIDHSMEMMCNAHFAEFQL